MMFAAICAFSVYGFSQTQEKTWVLDGIAEKVIDNRLYLRPGNVFVSANGIYVQTGEAFVQVDTVSSDEDGIYVDIDYFASLARCGICKRSYDPYKQYATCPHGYRHLNSCSHE